VEINGQPCSDPTWKDKTTVICTAPSGTGVDKPIVVTVGDQSSESADLYSYDRMSLALSCTMAACSL
jgi:hypothetical protein